MEYSILKIKEDILVNGPNNMCFLKHSDVGGRFRCSSAELILWFPILEVQT